MNPRDPLSSGADMIDIEMRLTSIKQSIDEINSEVTHREVMPDILKDFKLSLDHLRLTIWALITVEEQSGHGKRHPDIAMHSKLVEFRAKRLLRLLEDFRADLSADPLPRSSHDVQDLIPELRQTLDLLSTSGNA
jgi:hypothetical protein